VRKLFVTLCIPFLRGSYGEVHQAAVTFTSALTRLGRKRIFIVDSVLIHGDLNVMYKSESTEGVKGKATPLRGAGANRVLGRQSSHIF
jgi:hypothetical protein